MGFSGSPGRIQSPARSQAELTPLPPNGPHRAHVASPARGSDIWAAIDRRAPDIRPVIRPDIRPVIGSGIGSVIRPDIRPGVRPVIRSGIGSVIRPGIRPHIRFDIWPGIQPHVWPDIWPHIRPVIWPGVRSGIWSDIRSSVGPDIRPGPIAVAPGPNVGSPAHLLRRCGLRFGIDLCLEIGGTEDQEGSQSENIHAMHLKLLNDSFRLGRPPRSATKTIQSRKGHSGGSRDGRAQDPPFSRCPHIDRFGPAPHISPTRQRAIDKCAGYWIPLEWRIK